MNTLLSSYKDKRSTVDETSTSRKVRKKLKKKKVHQKWESDKKIKINTEIK
jgi:hypothetical protein